MAELDGTVTVNGSLQGQKKMFLCTHSWKFSARRSRFAFYAVYGPMGDNKWAFIIKSECKSLKLTCGSRRSFVRCRNSCATPLECGRIIIKSQHFLSYHEWYFKSYWTFNVRLIYCTSGEAGGKKVLRRLRDNRWSDVMWCKRPWPSSNFQLHRCPCGVDCWQTCNQLVCNRSSIDSSESTVDKNWGEIYEWRAWFFPLSEKEDSKDFRRRMEAHPTSSTHGALRANKQEKPWEEISNGALEWTLIGKSRNFCLFFFLRKLLSSKSDEIRRIPTQASLDVLHSMTANTHTWWKFVSSCSEYGKISQLKI